MIFYCALPVLRSRFSDLFSEPLPLHELLQQPPARLASVAAGLKRQGQAVHDAAALP